QQQQQRQQQNPPNQNGGNSLGGRGGQGGQNGPSIVAGIQVILLPAAGGSANGGDGGAGPAGRGTVQDDGTFESADVVPGPYMLGANFERNNTDYVALLPIIVAEGVVTNATLPLRP